MNFCNAFILIVIFITNNKNNNNVKCGVVKAVQQCEMNKNCFLPTCKCESNNSSVILSKFYRKDEIPQFVSITIDDDNLDIKSYQVYKKLFEGLKNPNNCSVKATFFLSDSNNQTSFCLARNLYSQQHEIAISTVNYTCPNTMCNVLGKEFVAWNYQVWLNQILNMRERLHLYSGIPMSDIIGFRAPVLEPAADMHYRIIQGNKFLYDSSLVTMEDNLMTWPFTLDFPIKSVLSNNGPLNAYQGLWELPLPT
jgi:hypothetical protein